MECPDAELLIEINEVGLFGSVLFETSSHARTASRRLRGRAAKGPYLMRLGKTAKRAQLLNIRHRHLVNAWAKGWMLEDCEFVI